MLPQGSRFKTRPAFSLPRPRRKGPSPAAVRCRFRRRLRAIRAQEAADERSFFRSPMSKSEQVLWNSTKAKATCPRWNIKKAFFLKIILVPEAYFSRSRLLQRNLTLRPQSASWSLLAAFRTSQPSRSAQHQLHERKRTPSFGHGIEQTGPLAQQKIRRQKDCPEQDRHDRRSLDHREQ